MIHDLDRMMVGPAEVVPSELKALMSRLEAVVLLMD